jgi:hypothetical protein
LPLLVCRDVVAPDAAADSVAVVGDADDVDVVLFSLVAMTTESISVSVRVDVGAGVVLGGVEVVVRGGVGGRGDGFGVGPTPVTVVGGPIIGVGVD